MKKWKSKLIAVVTALCMALSVPFLPDQHLYMRQPRQ